MGSATLRLAILTGATLFGAVGALAADLPARKPAPTYVPTAPLFTWTGLYVGANIGAGFTQDGGLTGSNSTWLWSNNGSSAGIIGGGQIGFNYQIAPMFVVGLETDFQATSLGSNNSGWFNMNSKLPWFGTVRGRVGLALADSRFLVYGTGGLAYGQVKNDWFGASATNTGWTAGGGVEYAFTPNWSAKAEYLYTSLTPQNNWNLFSTNSRARFHTVRVGVNYRFDMFQNNSPVVARY